MLSKYYQFDHDKQKDIHSCISLVAIYVDDKSRRQIFNRKKRKKVKDNISIDKN